MKNNENNEAIMSRNNKKNHSPIHWQFEEKNNLHDFFYWIKLKKEKVNKVIQKEVF